MAVSRAGDEEMQAPSSVMGLTPPVKLKRGKTPEAENHVVAGRVSYAMKTYVQAEEDLHHQVDEHSSDKARGLLTNLRLQQVHEKAFHIVHDSRFDYLSAA